MILKTSISMLRCVWLGSELNSAGKWISWGFEDPWSKDSQLQVHVFLDIFVYVLPCHTVEIYHFIKVSLERHLFLLNMLISFTNIAVCMRLSESLHACTGLINALKCLYLLSHVEQQSKAFSAKASLNNLDQILFAAVSRNKLLPLEWHKWISFMESSREGRWLELKEGLRGCSLLH